MNGTFIRYIIRFSDVQQRYDLCRPKPMFCVYIFSERKRKKKEAARVFRYHCITPNVLFLYKIKPKKVFRYHCITPKTCNILQLKQYFDLMTKYND